MLAFWTCAAQAVRIWMQSIDPVVKHETLRVALGTLVLSAVMELVFVLLGRWDYTVLLGNLLGIVAAVLNFFLMAVTVTRCVGMEKDKAALKIRASQLGRLFMLAAFAGCAALLPCFNLVAALVTLLFPSIVIAVLRLTAKKPAPEEGAEGIAPTANADSADGDDENDDENKPIWDS